MSSFKKILFVIYSLYIVGLMGLMYLALIPENAMSSTIDSFIFRGGLPYLVGLAVFIVILRMVLVVFQKSDQSYLSLTDNDGTIRLSNRSIENTVLFSLKDYDYIKEKSVKVSIKKPSADHINLAIFAKCGFDEDIYSIVDEEGLNGLFKSVREDVHASLEQLLGFRIEELDMKFYPIDNKDISDKKDKASTKKTYRKKISRVK